MCCHEKTDQQEDWRTGKAWLASGMDIAAFLQKTGQRANCGLHILLILVPEETRQEGCEFKAGLGYIKGLRSGFVFKKRRRGRRQLSA